MRRLAADRENEVARQRLAVLPNRILDMRRVDAPLLQERDPTSRRESVTPAVARRGAVRADSATDYQANLFDPGA